MSTSTPTTQVLLAAIAALLAVHALYLGGVLGTAQAEAAPPVADVLRARQIELVGADGTVVAQLYLGEDGGGNLRLRSPSGEVRVKLGAIADGAGLILMDARTEPAVHLASSRTGGTITLTHPDRPARHLTP